MTTRLMNFIVCYNGSGTQIEGDNFIIVKRIPEVTRVNFLVIIIIAIYRRLHARIMQNAESIYKEEKIALHANYLRSMTPKAFPLPPTTTSTTGAFYGKQLFLKRKVR